MGSVCSLGEQRLIHRISVFIYRLNTSLPKEGFVFPLDELTLSTEIRCFFFLNLSEYMF